ncbi:MAG: HK97 family phage prohead protease [Pikeienuella sp.]
MTLKAPARAESGLETKFVALDALEADLDKGRIAGYASLFGEPDQAGDVVARGAFAASLAATEAARRRVKFLWQHQPETPIGVWTRIEEDGAGLKVEGLILAEVTRGADAIALLKAGAIDGLSIGYRTIRAAPNAETGGRTLHEIDLWEVSLVTFPLLPTARASLESRETSGTDEFERALAAAFAFA